MPVEPSNPGREKVERLAEEFIERYRRGEHVQSSEYEERYPQHAAEIRDLFPALLVMEQIAPGSESGAGDADEAAFPGRPLEQFERLGDYRILREIGRGGMGVVYEAEQISLGRHVALKVLTQSAVRDPRQRKRFEREAKAAARLHHTNIVQVFGVGEDNGVCYYVMQFIQGQGLDGVVDELRQLLKDEGPLRSGRLAVKVPVAGRGPSTKALAFSLVTGQFQPPAEDRDFGDGPADIGDDSTVEGEPAASEADPSSSLEGRRWDSLSPSSSTMFPGPRTDSSPGRVPTYWQSVAHIGIQVAEAMHHAHELGILHRDIKPSNLLLDRQGTVWVTDFGLAKSDSDEDNLTATGDIIGTLRYMAPEVFNGAADIRSEVYSLGLTLYELLALRPAFDENDRHRLIHQLTTSKPASLEQLHPTIPRDLATIVHMAIDRDPERRYQTTGELAEDLQRFARDEPIRARRATSLERLARWARHHPGESTLLGVITLLLLAVTIASTIAAVQFLHLADDRQKALMNAERSAEEAQQHSAAERWQRYRSDIAAAGAALQLLNSGTSRVALERAPPEHRGWEWHHFHSQLDRASFVLPVPEIEPVSLVLSPDGRQIAAASRRGEIFLFDVATGRPGPVLRGHTGTIFSLQYSPDGRQIGSGAADGSIRIWDPETGRQKFILPGKGDMCLSYSPDGKRIASFEAWFETSTGIKTGTYRLWDATTGREIAKLGRVRVTNPNISHSEFVLTMPFSPDGTRLVAAAGEFVRMYDADTGRQLSVVSPLGSVLDRIRFSPDGGRFFVYDETSSTPNSLRDGDVGNVVADLGEQLLRTSSVAFNADGSLLATALLYPENLVQLRETGTGKLIRVLSGHANTVECLAFSPDGKRLASASLDQTGRLWDVETGREIAVLRGHTGILSYVAFSPDGTRLVTASWDHTLRLWDAKSGDLIAVLRGHGDRVWPTAFTPDGVWLISPSNDKTIRLWDMDLIERNSVLRGHAGFVYDVAFRPDGEEVASAAWDGTVRLWDPTSGRQTHLLDNRTGIMSAVADGDASGIESADAFEGEWDIMSAVAYSPNNGRLATANRTQGVSLWNPATAEREHIWPFAAGAWNSDGQVAFSPDGSLVAAGSAAGSVFLWDVTTRQQVAELSGHERASEAVAFAPDGTLLASAGLGGTIRLWDVATRDPAAVMRGHTAQVDCLAFSADGTLLASGSHDGTLRLWDRHTREVLATVSVGSIIHGIAFSPDGTRLALGCADTTIRLIDVASRQEVAELHGHTDYVHAVAWSPDGTRLVSGSGDRTARVWDSLPPADRSSPRVGSSVRH